MSWQMEDDEEADNDGGNAHTIFSHGLIFTFQPCNDMDLNLTYALFIGYCLELVNICEE